MLVNNQHSLHRSPHSDLLKLFTHALEPGWYSFVFLVQRILCTKRIVRQWIPSKTKYLVVIQRKCILIVASRSYIFAKHMCPIVSFYMWKNYFTALILLKTTQYWKNKTRVRLYVISVTAPTTRAKMWNGLSRCAKKTLEGISQIISKNWLSIKILAEETDEQPKLIASLFLTPL